MSNNRLLHGLGLLALLCATSSGSALTIGRQQGQAVLGRPLEVQVPVGLDPGMDPADLCPEAEVSYGETRLPTRMVDVQVTGLGEVARVQVRAIPPLDEPFASVQLRIGCSQKLSRRFVLLAEEPTGLLTSAAALVVPTLVDGAPPTRTEVPAPSHGAADGASAESAASATPGQVRTSSPAVSPGTSAPTPSPAPRHAGSLTEGPDVRPPDRTPKRAPPATTPRLRLDPVDIQLPQAVPPDTATSGSAASLGEDIALRNQVLQAEVRQLQQALQTSHRAGAALRGRLAEAERERFANPVVFGLAAVSLLALLLAGLIWRRTVAASRPRTGPPPLSARSVSTMPTALWPLTPIDTGVAPVAAPSQPTDQGLPPLSPGAVAAADSERDPASTAHEQGKARSLASMNARLPEPLPLSTLELNDIQQEADFFVSLGEHDRAIELLRSHIEQHPQSSALAWLDLMEIQHKLGRRDAYEQVRRDFEWLFNVKLPSFEAFDSAHDDLEAHSELMGRIQAAWPSAAALKVIDRAIFRTPVDGQGKAMGLQAYRDLLFLHQLAQAPAASSRSVPSTHPLQTRSSTIDLDLDAILARPASAPDPTRSHGAQERLTQGVDALIHFDTEGPEPAEPRHGLSEEAGWRPARRRAG